MLFRTLHAEKDLFFMDNNQPIAALFDLDGVIVDTESQYTLFWRRQGDAYRPDMPHVEQRIKGMTLTQILEFFADQPGIPERIQEELNQFETRMDYTYVPGATDFIRALRTQDIRTAVVTSSNTKKMENLLAGRRAGMTVIGLSTTNPEAAIRDLADVVIPDFTGFSVEKMHVLIRQ